jgi:hypothetical protein
MREEKGCAAAERSTSSENNQQAGEKITVSSAKRKISKICRVCILPQHLDSGFGALLLFSSYFVLVRLANFDSSDRVPKNPC